MHYNITKFYHCVCALNHQDAAQIVDLIQFPPEDRPYKIRKDHLIKFHTLKPF